AADQVQALPPVVISVGETITAADEVQALPPAVISVGETFTATDGVQVLPQSLVTPTPTPTPAPRISRATVDRPDDSSEFQIHLIYALPSDGTDEELDTHGAIADSIEAIQIWFEEQTNGKRLRFDTFQGEYDISFIRFSEAEATFKNYGQGIGVRIEQLILEAGFDTNKIQAVFYDGGADGCGVSQIDSGNIAVIFIGQDFGCAFNPSQGQHYAGELGWGFVMVHEIFHNLGIVSDCSPNSKPGGHVDDDRFDLMASPNDTSGTIVIDAAHDDYFQASVNGCVDLADSAILVPPNPDSVLPDPWNFVELHPEECRPDESYESLRKRTLTTRVNIYNGSSQDLLGFF
ncbi:MAG: hypothetical protein IH872_00910, partial [Chloroflexi bacterium]|nr:hypothetical protein [Chloroflexota bacterium]